MDQRWLDDLARGLAVGTISRRQWLKALFALAGGVVLNPFIQFSPKRGFFSLGMESAFAQMPCQPTNDVPTRCEDLSQYAKDCGVICPDGERKQGWDGCTIPNFSQQITRADRISFKKMKGKWCASTTLTWVWSTNPQTAILNWTPTEPLCCGKTCSDEYRERLQAHEDGHVAIINNLRDDVNQVWRDRFFKECCVDKSCKTPTDAQKLLEKAISDAKTQTIEFANNQLEIEPPHASSPQCGSGPCTPAVLGRGCCNGTCVDLTTDPNCGTCGNVCDSSNCLRCDNGQCVSSCLPNQICQNGACVDDPCSPGTKACFSADGTSYGCCNDPAATCFTLSNGQPGCCHPGTSDPSVCEPYGSLPKMCCHD